MVAFYDDHHVAEKMRQEGVDVRILRNFQPLDFGAALLKGGAAARRFAQFLTPVQKAGNLVWFFLRPALSYARFLNANAIDLVHLNNSINTNHDWMLAAKLARVRLVSHERGISERPTRTARWLGKSADRLVCITKMVRSRLLEHGIAADKAVVIYNGVDPNEVRVRTAAPDLRRAYGIAPADPVIGVIGNIKKWKGQEVAVRATALLKSSWPTVKCMLVGEHVKADQYGEHLQRLVRDLHLEGNVMFTGYQRHPADFINVMDVVVHTSIEPEPFGRVNIEAMYLGKPVVATNLGGPLEIFVDGKNGLLIEGNRPELLADRVSSLLKDPAWRARMGAMARQTVIERFTVAQTAREIEELYARLTTPVAADPLAPRVRTGSSARR
jgi:glycosyltransferase involved in cell wall biosynthesis